MSTLNKPKTDEVAVLPKDAALYYIVDMLSELSKIAEKAGLRDVASLLLATRAASKSDVKTVD